MILKFLRNKKGGSTASINYLLNKERVQNGTAKILAGDEQNTRDIINSITKKQKVTFGVLSFEEENIPEQQKKELMQEFEKTFFAGMDKEQYNILWVEHTDKGRLELNFIIPKVELSTGKTFNPYYHKTDFHLADLFERTANLKYNFTDPKDPAKESSIQGSKKAFGLFKGYRNLDKKLKELVSDGVLQSKDDILEVLKNNNIEIISIDKDTIEVKLEGNKKPRKLKGGIYTNGFTNIDELRNISKEKAKRERKFAVRDNESEYREVSERLKRAVSKRAVFYAKQYREPKKSAYTAKRDKQEYIRRTFEQTSTNSQTSKEGKEIGNIRKRTQKSKLLAEDERGINGTRRTIQNRERERETTLTRVRERTRESRTSLYTQFRENRKSLYEQTRAIMQDRANSSERDRRRAKRTYESIKQLNRGFSKLQNELSSGLKGINEQSSNFIKTAQELARDVEQFVEKKKETSDVQNFLSKVKDFDSLPPIPFMEDNEIKEELNFNIASEALKNTAEFADEYNQDKMEELRQGLLQDKKEQEESVKQEEQEPTFRGIGL